MRALRFSLRGLLVGIVYVSIVLFAFVSGSLLWADIIYSLSIGFILIATLAALFGRGVNRIFWQGLCVIAWIYLFLAFGPSMEGNLRNRLVTHRILENSQRVFAPIHAARVADPGFEIRQDNDWRYQTGPRSFFPIYRGRSWQVTQRIGHSMWAIVLGIVGGYLALYFRGEQRTESSSK